MFSASPDGTCFIRPSMYIIGNSLGSFWMWSSLHSDSIYGRFQSIQNLTLLSSVIKGTKIVTSSHLLSFYVTFLCPETTFPPRGLMQACCGVAELPVAPGRTRDHQNIVRNSPWSPRASDLLGLSLLTCLSVFLTAQCATHLYWLTFVVSTSTCYPLYDLE